jgi:hypothetical protein
MKTIRRNSKQLAAIFSKATECKVYRLDFNFIGQDCEIQWAQKAYEQFDFAKLYAEKPGVYMLHVHDNFWYRFQSQG